MRSSLSLFSLTRLKCCGESENLDENDDYDYTEITVTELSLSARVLILVTIPTRWSNNITFLRSWNFNKLRVLHSSSHHYYSRRISKRCGERKECWVYFFHQSCPSMFVLESSFLFVEEYGSSLNRQFI